MANRPVIGQTTWGGTLNDHLDTSINVDGTLKATAIATKQDKSWQQTKRYTSDTTSSGSLVTITALDLTIGVGEVWKVQFDFQVGSDGAGGLQIQFASTGTAPAIKFFAVGPKTNRDTITTSAISALNTASSTFVASAGEYNGWIQITGFVTGGAASGVLRTQFKSAVSAQVSRFWNGSSVIAWRIA